jgi:hypothetical protein
VQVNWLFGSLASLLNVMLLLSGVILMFSILGVQVLLTACAINSLYYEPVLLACANSTYHYSRTLSSGCSSGASTDVCMAAVASPPSLYGCTL